MTKYTLSSSGKGTFDPFSAYSTDLNLTVHSSGMLSPKKPEMRVDILENNSAIATLRLCLITESSELRECATRDDMVKQELDILPGTDIRMVSCSPFELRCDKKPPVSFVGGNIRSQDSSYPLATFSQTKSGIFKKSTGTADLTIYNMSAVAPAVCFILIIASKAYQACVWNKNLDDLAKQHDLTQYDKAQGMIFSSAGAAGAF